MGHNLWPISFSRHKEKLPAPQPVIIKVRRYDDHQPEIFQRWPLNSKSAALFYLGDSAFCGAGTALFAGAPLAGEAVEPIGVFGVSPLGYNESDG
jgi:hypothetical protein